MYLSIISTYHNSFHSLASALSYFKEVQQFWIANSTEGGMFLTLVNLEQCAGKCLNDPQCKTFMTASDGSGLCYISYQDTTSPGYQYSFSMNLFVRQQFSSFDCPYSNLSACWRASAPHFTPLVPGATCTAHLATYQACVTPLLAGLY